MKKSNLILVSIFVALSLAFTNSNVSANDDSIIHNQNHTQDSNLDTAITDKDIAVTHNDLLDDYETKHSGKHQVVATAGTVNTDTHRPSVYDDDKGTHIQVGGDPQHGIYHNPSETNSGGMKCSEECGPDCRKCTNDWASYEWYKDHKKK